MKYKIETKKDTKNIIKYITYENGKTIELSRNYQYKLLYNNKYIFLLHNKKIDKVFDINNRRFITKSIDMQILYNNFKREYVKQKKILKPKN